MVWPWVRFRNHSAALKLQPVCKLQTDWCGLTYMLDKLHLGWRKSASATWHKAMQRGTKISTLVHIYLWNQKVSCRNSQVVRLHSGIDISYKSKNLPQLQDILKQLPFLQLVPGLLRHTSAYLGIWGKDGCGWPHSSFLPSLLAKWNWNI